MQNRYLGVFRNCNIMSTDTRTTRRTVTLSILGLILYHTYSGNHIRFNITNTRNSINSKTTINLYNTVRRRTILRRIMRRINLNPITLNRNNRSTNLLRPVRRLTTRMSTGNIKHIRRKALNNLNLGIRMLQHLHGNKTVYSRVITRSSRNRTHNTNIFLHTNMGRPMSLSIRQLQRGTTQSVNSRQRVTTVKRPIMRNTGSNIILTSMSMIRPITHNLNNGTHISINRNKCTIRINILKTHRRRSLTMLNNLLMHLINGITNRSMTNTTTTRRIRKSTHGLRHNTTLRGRSAMIIKSTRRTTRNYLNIISSLLMRTESVTRLRRKRTTATMIRRLINSLNRRTYKRHNQTD